MTDHHCYSICNVHNYILDPPLLDFFFLIALGRALLMNQVSIIDGTLDTHTTLLLFDNEGRQHAISLTARVQAYGLALQELPYP